MIAIKEAAKNVVDERLAIRVQPNPATPLNDEEVECIANTVCSHINYALAGLYLEPMEVSQLSQSCPSNTCCSTTISLYHFTCLFVENIVIQHSCRQPTERYRNIMVLHTTPHTAIMWDGTIPAVPLSVTKCIPKRAWKTEDSAAVHS